MNHQRRHITTGLAVLSTGLLFSVNAGAQTGKKAQPQTSKQPSALVFGLISPRSAAETRANWEPFVKRLGAAVNLPVELRVYESQGDVVKAFIASEIDIAWMGNAPAMEVVEAGAGDVFAQMVTKDGSFGYKSILVVNRNQAVQTLPELISKAKNLRFSDGDPKSTSGYLVPLYFAFNKNGISDTKAIFKSVETGSHQQNLTKVAQDSADVATANNEEMAFFQRDFPDLAKNVKPVWESPLIPQSPLLWKSSLQTELKKSIKKFVVNFGATDAEEKSILLAVNGLSRFRASGNQQLVPIADLEMFKARQAVNNDKSLSEEERLARINTAIKRGSRLEHLLKFSPPSV